MIDEIANTITDGVVKFMRFLDLSDVLFSDGKNKSYTFAIATMMLIKGITLDDVNEMIEILSKHESEENEHVQNHNQTSC